jgi:putative endonuclease
MKNGKAPCVYMLASGRNCTLYIGVTGELNTRISQHKSGTFMGFTARHGVHRLVWYESHDRMESAIVREKQLKKWNRAWKLRLIEEANPQWSDLSLNLLT